MSDRLANFIRRFGFTSEEGKRVLETLCAKCGQEYGDHSVIHGMCPNVHAPGLFLLTVFQSKECSRCGVLGCPGTDRCGNV